MEIDQPEDALQYYLEAANVIDTNFSSPLYLFRAGNVAMELGKFNDAESYYTKIKENYSKSEEGKNISIYIQRAQLAQK